MCTWREIVKTLYLFTFWQKSGIVQTDAWMDLEHVDILAPAINHQRNVIWMKRYANNKIISNILRIRFFSLSGLKAVVSAMPAVSRMPDQKISIYTNKFQQYIAMLNWIRRVLWTFFDTQMRYELIRRGEWSFFSYFFLFIFEILFANGNFYLWISSLNHRNARSMWVFFSPPASTSPSWLLVP